MRLIRTLAVVATTAVTAGLVAGTPGPASAARVYDGRPVAQGAGWLSSQLTKNLVHNDQFDFDDIGLSIDVALGLDAAGTKATVVKGITKAVAKNVAFYVGDGDQGIYAGATAKAAVLAESQGRNPRAFGGIDLIGQLEGRVATTAPIAGRIQDAYDPTSQYGGDYANVIGQAYAAQALAAVKSPQAAAVTRFLLEQQCSDGYFRLGFTQDKTAADQSCDAAPKAQRSADTDATAIAVIALQDVKGSTAKKAVAKAVAWLVDVQARNGAFGGGRSTKDANANSTGLAGWALGTAATDGTTRAAAAQAAVWVRHLQVPAANPCNNKLGGDVGAIAYDQDAYGAGQGFGIKKKTSDQWRRTSAQAMPALQWAPKAVGDFTASAPKSVASGAKLRIALTGLAPGTRICVVEGASSYETWSRSKTTSFAFPVASDPGVRTFQVWQGDQRRDVTVRVTG